MDDILSRNNKIEAMVAENRKKLGKTGVELQKQACSRSYESIGGAE